MKPIDLSGLIKGLLVVIGIALAMGKLDDLKRLAIREAFPDTARKPNLQFDQKRTKNVSTHPIRVCTRDCE